MRGEQRGAVSDRHLGAPRDFPQRRDLLVEVSGTTDLFIVLADARGHLLERRRPAASAVRWTSTVATTPSGTGLRRSAPGAVPSQPSTDMSRPPDVGQGEDRPAGHRGGSADGAPSMATSLRGATVW